MVGINKSISLEQKERINQKHSNKSLQFIHYYNLIITIDLNLHNKIKMQVVVIKC